MMRRPASVIAALSLLASAATAYAECAWLLWVRTSPEGTTPERWEAVSSFPRNTMQAQGITIDLGHQGCLKERETTVNQIFAEQEKRGLPKNTWALCLPDTVDPRGPKGT